MDQSYRFTSGKGSVTNASATTVILAAPGAGKKLAITWGTIPVTLAATGGGGLVSLKDGTTTIVSFPANTADTYYLELGDDGYILSENSALNLVVESAGSNQASANAVICGYIVG
jgi:hypothetical protein